MICWYSPKWCTVNKSFGKIDLCWWSWSPTLILNVVIKRRSCHTSDSGQPRTRLVTQGQRFNHKGYSYTCWQSIQTPWNFYLFSIKHLILNKFIKLRFSITHHFIFFQNQPSLYLMFTSIINQPIIFLPKSSNSYNNL